MTIIGWIIIGVVAGFLAKLISPAGYGGFLADLVVGVIGAVIGGWIMAAFGHVGVNGLNLHSLLVAVLGAVILLWVYKAFAYRRM
ncbi:MAG: GlsB/YeaQ/YmgE family stress response membrane protein [Candidatus Xenobia bacterium]